jgi:carbon storage regulator CsrA
MLVLSRRVNQKVLFPAFNTSVQVLSVKGSSVRLGIDAPHEVQVVREELQHTEGQSAATTMTAAMAADARTRQLNHLLRNRLNVAGIGLALLARQLDAGLLQDGKVTLDKLHEDFELLRERLETEATERSAPSRTTVAPAKTTRALLVEDDQNERELLAGLLRLSGLQVDVAGDGCDALDYLRTQTRPDVILIDMILPRCDGPTAVRQIRSDPANRNLKIFGVTGHSPESFHLEGVNRWFRKPLNPEVLLHDLNEELERSSDQ